MDIFGGIITLTGSIFLFLGACIPKIIILILFIIFTNPISSHALARAAHHIGIPLTDRSVIDALGKDEKETGEETA